MGLAEIAAGLRVTDEQCDRGVATVDRTGAPLRERLAEHADRLPCRPAVAAAVVEVYAEGRSIGTAASVAGIAPMTAAKTLHLLGEQVAPLGPTGREVVQDWLAGDIARTVALELTGATDAEFALAVYVETHDPIPDARDAVAATLTAEPTTDPLGDAMSDVSDLRES